MPADLTDSYVANTYKGILHVGGEELPGAGVVPVNDGAGNTTALKLGTDGVSCIALSATGLIANNLKYPEQAGNNLNVVCQTTNNATGTNNLELRPLNQIICETKIGLESYQRTSPNVVPLPVVECGIINKVNEESISTITEADGGISVDETGEYAITRMVSKGGLLTAFGVRTISRPINPNLLINAQGIINQRQIPSNTTLNQGWNPRQYFIDRWKAINPSGNSAGRIWSLTNNVVIIQAGNGICQRIERVNIIPGIYTLSWIGTASATVLENGSNRSAQGTTTIGEVNVRNYSLLGNGNVEVRFSGGSVSLPKFERGSIRTEFDYRSFGAEFQLCLRYFAKTYEYETPPQTANRQGSIQHHGIEPINPTAHNLQWRYPVEVAPTDVRVFSFNPLSTQAPNHFAVIGQLDSDAERETRSHTCTVSYGSSSVYAVQRTSGADNLYPNGVRLSTAHFVVDAEL